MRFKKYTFLIIITLFVLLLMISVSLKASELDDEELIIIDVDIDDDFSDNTVIIVLKHSVSLEFIDYTIEDFSEIDCIKVEDLTEYTTRIVKDEIYANKTGDYSKLKERIDKNMLVNIETFHRILCLYLGNPGKENVVSAIKELERRDDIISAEPDYIEHIENTPNDTYYISDDQWGLNDTFGINAPKAWNFTTGNSNLLVGVIDSGIDVSHSDLVNNINDSLHRDYVDHPWYTTYQDVSKSNLDDPNGHGTHVAGIIGAQGKNSLGVCGVLWNIKLVSLRVSDVNGDNSSSDAKRAIDYATEKNIKILNYSNGGTNDHSGRKNAIQNYPGLFVCSAGNSNQDNDSNAHFPSNYRLSNLIAVGAIKSDGNRPTVLDWGYRDYPDNTEPQGSNYGATTVDIFAPGDDIISTYPLDLYDSTNPRHIAVGYYKTGGTSMATPFVTGVAALMLSINQNLTPQQIKATIMNNATKYSTLTNLCVCGGRLDAFKAVAAVALSTSYNVSGLRINGFASNYTIPINMELEIPSSFSILTNVFGSIEYSATEINSNAFKNKTNLTNIILPNTITNIGDSVFEGCSGINSVTLPAYVNSLGNCTFKDCSAITSITLPSYITNIGESAFKGCSSLSTINIPSSVTTINQSVFENCSSLSSISLPNTITSIGESAFKGCSSLSSITIGQNVYSIGDYAFMNCTSLSNVTIGRDITNITSLGTSAFNNCSSSLSIKVPINRLAQYKNETNWHFYRTNITSNPLTFDEININCLSSNESRTVTLDQYKRKLYKINVSCNANYQVQVTGLVRTNLYDSDMEYISTNFNTFYLNLSSGVYYIDMEYDYQEFGSVTISFSSINYPGSDIYFGSNNCLTHLHPVDSSFSLNKLKYNNTQGVGFYKFTLTGEKVDLTPLLYYDGAITLYSNEARTQIIDRLDISNYSYNSFTNQGENSMWVYLPRSGYFYIDINMPTANYLNLSLTISSPTTQEVNIFDMPSVMSYQNITLMTSIDERSDYVKEIEVKQAGVFNIACSYSGLQSSYIDLFLITKNDSDIIYTTTLSSSNTYRSSFVLLEEGVYYLGYFDLNVGSIADVHLNRYIDNESTEVYNTLITDPNSSSCGSEITILEEGLTNKSFYGNIITVGFTRLIYLDSYYCNYSLSRLDYYWYSSDSSKARVTSYGTVLGVDDTSNNETVTILAVLKSDPSIIYVKDFTIREDSGVGSIAVYNNYSIKYSDTNNGVFHLHLESITMPYPMYTYYMWTTSNESSGLIVSNDNWGNYTVNTYGSFTLIATDYIYNDRITIYINVTITNN